MDNPSQRVSRRSVLSRAAFASGLVWAHSGVANAQGGPGKEQLRLQSRIKSLVLETSAPLQRMKEFYHDSLGLPILENSAGRLTVRAGESTLTFIPAAGRASAPFYHFAFNIPENKILQARRWQLNRGPLMPIPQRLRAEAFPDDIVNYTHWNAHSIFFYDPGGNVVEYIARHDLKNAARGPFSAKHILCASEIAFIVDDVAAANAGLRQTLGLPQYRGASDQFAAIGDEQGLVLIMKRGRILNFDDTSHEKAASVYPTQAVVRVPKSAEAVFPGMPYKLTGSDG